MKRVAYGHRIEIEIFKGLLESANIVSLIKNEFEEAAHAGFGSGIPGNEELLVDEGDVEKALTIIEAYKKNKAD